MKGKKYRLVQLPFMAFFSKKLYRDIGRNWQGGNLSYLFLLLAICCIPAALLQRENILQSLKPKDLQIINQIPDIYIKSGRVVVDEKMPYYIRNAQGEPVAIIDTTGSMNYIDDDTVNVMLTETKLIVRRGEKAFNTFDLRGVYTLHLNPDIIQNGLGYLRETVSPLTYAIFLLLSYILAVLVMLLVSVVGLILSNLMNSALSFKDTMRIAVTAATPAIITIFITSALGYRIPGYVYIAITAVYLFRGITSCNGHPDEPVLDCNDLKAVLRPEIQKALDKAA